MPCENGVDSRPLWRWMDVTRPITGAQGLQHGRGDRRTLAPGNSIDIDGARKLESFDGDSRQHRWRAQAARRDGDAESGFEQRDQVLLGRHFTPAIDINVVVPQD